VLGQYTKNLNINGTTKTCDFTNSFLACLDTNGNTLWLVDGQATGNVFPINLTLDNIRLWTKILNKKIAIKQQKEAENV